MSDSGGALVKIYRGALRLYPRSFRDQYSDDMVQLFRDQLADESRLRVATRTAVDLFLTVPARHVEAHMNRKITPLVILIGTVLLAGAAFGFVEGLVGILIAMVGCALAVIAWRREQPIAVRRATSHWWQFLAIGIGLLTVMIVSTTISGELSEFAWAIAAVTVLTSVALIATGCVLAILRIGDRSSGVAA
jgi:hypothetical protein